MSNVWGNTVTVPQGAKPPLDPNVRWTRDNSQGAGSNPDEKEAGNQDGNVDENQDGSQEGNQGGDKVASPTVLMPDGSRIPADTFFAKEKTELAVKEAYVQGILEGQKQSGVIGDDSPDETEKAPESTTPAFQKIEVDEEKHYEPNEQMLIDKNNENVDVFNSVMTKKDEELGALKTQLGEVTDAVSKQIFDSNLAMVEATTGVSRDEIISKNQETKITDPEILAKIILGEKAANGEELPTAVKQAEEEREENNKGVSGTSQNNGGGNQGGGANEPFRGLDPNEINLGGKIDSATLQKIGSAYSFAPQVVNNG